MILAARVLVALVASSLVVVVVTAAAAKSPSSQRHAGAAATDGLAALLQKQQPQQRPPPVPRFPHSNETRRHRAFSTAHVAAQARATRHNEPEGVFRARSSTAPYHTNDGTGPVNLTAARGLVRDMFMHGYYGYLDYGYPEDELDPVLCQGQPAQGDYQLTLIDSADTLAIMGEWREFAHAVQLIEQIPTIGIAGKGNVSLFETNIRILGGLLSTHLIAQKSLVTYKGKLLDLAIDLGNRLMPAFNAPSGIPFGTVNLRHGVPPDETPVVCTACATSLSLEFGYLSHLTGNPKYALAAKRAAQQVWALRSDLDLVGNHLDSETGEWTSKASGIAGSLDSMYEYFLKAWIVFHDPDYYELFVQSYEAVERHASFNHWHILVMMQNGYPESATFASLQAFWSGMQVLAGDVYRGTQMMERMCELMSYVPFFPELVGVGDWTYTSHKDWPQRPELVESMLAVYQATKDPGMFEAGLDFTLRMYDWTITECGYAGIRDVTTMELLPRQESFFLSETLKYLYLLFDPDNEYNRPEYVFTTEAHPLPVLVNSRHGNWLARIDPSRRAAASPPATAAVEGLKSAATHGSVAADGQPRPGASSSAGARLRELLWQVLARGDDRVTVPPPRRRAQKKPSHALESRWAREKRRVPWTDQMCDAREARIARGLYSLAPPGGLGTLWIGDWGHMRRRVF
ncbi:glycoside hydrolase [Blastocladiella britannica]|nr:glycoside hydrolase [Blastocladiella britannica]